MVCCVLFVACCVCLFVCVCVCVCVKPDSKLRGLELRAYA